MTPASILFAFLAILAPGAVVYIGLKWIAHRRAAKTKAAQDKEMREHDERHERMAKMRAARYQSDQRVLEARALHDHKKAMLRSVPKPAYRDDPMHSFISRDDEVVVSPSLTENWPIYSFANGGVAAPDPVAFTGSGGSFDGGGASGDYSPSESCTPSDSGSSDSPSCGSGD